jgi:transcriptional regulator with XRE-family HTH domain
MTTQGERLKKIRRKLGLSQTELGEKLGFSKQYLSNIEADRNLMNNDKLVKLLVDFNVNINYLLAGVGEMFNTPTSNEEFRNSEMISLIDEALKRHGLIK